MLKISSAE